MIQTHGLGVTATDVRILRDVSLTLPASRIAVIGENGSGKSTFARVLCGLIAPTTGSARVADVNVSDLRRLRPLVGMVFQNPDAQLLMPTPAEDVALSLRADKAGRRECAARTAEALSSVGLCDLADVASTTLSGGQKQLLALASALVRRPRVLIADEPTTLLDLPNARRVADLLVEAPCEQVVIVTHDLELARRCDVAVRFHAGAVVEAGEPEHVIASYRAMYA